MSIFQDPYETFDLTLPDLNSTFDQVIIVFAFIFFLLGGFANALNIPFFTRDGGLLSYSKFATNVSFGYSISSQLGMTILYAPAFLFALLIATDSTTGGHPRVYVTSILMTIHFFKRTLECNFLHRYSGTMPLISSITISCFYCLLAFCCIHYSQASALVHDPKVVTANNAEFEQHLDKIMSTMFVGLVLFVIGQVGNLYHHYLLATLRSGDIVMTRYKVPTGGLFSNFGGAAAPHYLFELISWYGVVIVTKHINILLFAIGMTAYLLDRAAAQNEWNKEKLKDDYPTTRKNMIPYLL